jgi:transposase
MGRKIKYVVRLTSDERKLLFELLKQGKANKEKLNRARILLKADCGIEGENWDDDKIAEALYISQKTVLNTRQALIEEGLDKTLNRTPIQKKRKRIVQGEEEAHLVALACQEPPKGHCRWTLRLLSAKMVELEYVDSISYETVRDALKKTNLSLGKKKNGVSLHE